MDSTTRNILIGSTLSTITGSGIVVANLDVATVGMLITAAGAIVSSLVAGYVAIINARSKAELEKIKAHNEAQVNIQKLQLEASARNATALQTIQTAVHQNTVETIKGASAAATAAATAASAADQTKTRVEQLSERIAISKSETEPPVDGQ